MPAMKDLVKGPTAIGTTSTAMGRFDRKGVDRVENPATGAIIATVPNGSAEDADRALMAAHRLSRHGKHCRRPARGKLLKDLARLILENRERLARMVIAEQGKPLHEARGEIEGAALYLSYAAEEARRITGDIIPSDMPDEQIWIQHVAHGVVVGADGLELSRGVDVPKVGPALVAGNTIVIKSHEGTPIPRSK